MVVQRECGKHEKILWVRSDKDLFADLLELLAYFHAEVLRSRPKAAKGPCVKVRLPQDDARHLRILLEGVPDMNVVAA